MEARPRGMMARNHRSDATVVVDRGWTVKHHFRFAVIGCGVIGSSAVYWLARAFGQDVIGFERYSLGHDKGASGDHSRIIRLSYHAPAYTALTPHAYAAWHEVEDASGMQLVTICGGVDITPRDQPELVDAYAAAMGDAGILFEDWTGAEAMIRFPQFTLDPECRVLFQERSGLVDPRKGIHTQIALARGHGATVLDNTPVQKVIPDGDGFRLPIEEDELTADHVIVAADAWTNELLTETGVHFPLTVTEEQVTYFATPHLRDFMPDRFPIWISHGADSFYGFPVYGEVATKAGLDIGGDEVTLTTRQWEPNPRAHDKLVEYMQRTIPDALGPELFTRTCLYTMPPDRDFIVDRVPGHERLLVVQGAAHGAKFACLLGKIAGQLVVTSATDYPISAFRADRPALTDPTYPRSFKI
jgi:sarcosine oxidase